MPGAPKFPLDKFPVFLYSGLMFFPRYLYSSLLAHLKAPEVTVITGMRRTGKTFLLKELYNQIPANKVFLDLENRVNQELFKIPDYEEIKNRLVVDYQLDEKKKIYLFLDEIQNLPNIPSVAKYLLDHYQIKFVVTGSSSFYLKNLFSESLAGRKQVFEIFPLTFEEFLIFKGKKKTLSLDKANWPPAKKFDLDAKNYARLFEEYLRYGGFPGVVLTPQTTQKEKMLKDILYSYVDQDVKKLADFSKIEDLEKLIKLLAERVGQKIEVSRLASEVGLSRITVNQYLEFLEKTYLISRISPFTSSRGREISKAKKLYFCDSGLANILSPNSLGQMLENCVYNTLRVKYVFARVFGEINYYQRENGAEIDFVVDKKLAIEVKTTGGDFDQRKLAQEAKKLKISQTLLISQNLTPAKNIVYAASL